MRTARACPNGGARGALGAAAKRVHKSDNLHRIGNQVTEPFCSHVQLGRYPGSEERHSIEGAEERHQILASR